MDPKRRLRLARIAGFFVGIVLLYAPFALVARSLAWAMPGLAMASTRPDVHTACARMLLQAPSQPWLLALVRNNPLYLLPLLVLPVVALVWGPLFCGWLCPAGGITEHVSRVVPESLKVDLTGLPTAQVRYGFLGGFLVAPWVSSSICCSFCNFTPMQGVVSAATGDFRPIAYWSSTGIVTALVWFVFLGVLTTGGRGWCVTLCPTGAVQSLAHSVGTRFGWARRVTHTAGACASCGACANACPTRAIAVQRRELVVNRHLCNACLECTTVCPNGALQWRKHD